MAKLWTIINSDDFKFPANHIAKTLGIHMSSSSPSSSFDRIEAKPKSHVVESEMKKVIRDSSTVTNESHVLNFLAQKKIAMCIPEILEELYPMRIKEHDSRATEIFEKFLDKMVTSGVLLEDGVNHKGKWHSAYKINSNRNLLSPYS